MYSILAWNVQNHVGFWGSVPDPAGELKTVPQTPSREGIFAFGAKFHVSPQAKIPAPLAPQTQILEPPL